MEPSPIYRITPEMLREDVLRQHLYPNVEQVLFWDDSWDPEFYIALARAGFICIAHRDPDLGPLLIPELQEAYAVLDWDEVHYSRKVRELLNSKRLTEEDIKLRLVDDTEAVVERLVAHHESCWLIEPYRDLLRQLPASSGGTAPFAIHGVELWSRRRNELIAGELGYTVGRTYTSLSGFCSPHDPDLRHFGTLQMLLLANALRERRYAFWNMGHPGLPYKTALGARILPRHEFLARWMRAR